MEKNKKKYSRYRTLKTICYLLGFPLFILLVYFGSTRMIYSDSFVETKYYGLIAVVLIWLAASVLQGIFSLFVNNKYVFVFYKDKLRIGLRSPIIYLLAGLFLGTVASFLGIGGGSLNTALLMMLFSLYIKEAAFCSLSIIVASQGAKIIMSAATGSFAAVNSPLMLATLCCMVVAGVAGGFLGSILSSKCSEKTVVRFFYGVQAVILIISIINIVSCAVELSA